jgi:hypothetical protein
VKLHKIKCCFENPGELDRKVLPISVIKTFFLVFVTVSVQCRVKLDMLYRVKCRAQIDAFFLTTAG